MFSKKPKCKACGRVGHTKMTCPTLPRKLLQSKTKLKPKKRMRQMGKIGKKLAQQSKDFLADYKPPYLCVYCLVIGYENFLLPEWANVEHGEAKAGHPDKRFVKTNLYISCRFHNKDKGTKDIDEYINYLKEQMKHEREIRKNSKTV